MAIKSSILDPANGSGVFAGDLRYGRCLGSCVVKHQDFARIDDETGQENLPAVPLILVTPRDPSVWQNKNKKKPRKSKVSNQELHDQLLMNLSKFTTGLSHNLSRIKRGK
jgi:hypothetical protein